MHEEVSELLPFLCNHQLFSCSWICCRTHTQEHTHSSLLCALKAARITLHLSAGLLDLVTLARSIHLSAGRLTCSFSLSVRLSLSPTFSPFLSFSTQICVSLPCPFTRGRCPISYTTLTVLQHVTVSALLFPSGCILSVFSQAGHVTQRLAADKQGRLD